MVTANYNQGSHAIATGAKFSVFDLTQTVIQTPAWTFNTRIESSIFPLGHPSGALSIRIKVK